MQFYAQWLSAIGCKEIPFITPKLWFKAFPTSKGELNLHDWKMQDWKMTDEVARVEISGLENDGQVDHGL